MIVFEKIRWKNFLSTGNQFNEIQLNESPSTLIVGSNGAGKSTMLDALCFCLFNKPFRKINKPQLVNTVNERECVVEIEFRIGGTEYKVTRGIKPNVFEITRNGQLIDQDAANRDYQKYLEQSILKLNYKSFTQVVILGSSTFVPFMQLPAAHRREVIEDLLDIQIFSQMNMLLKERIKDNNEMLRDCKHQLELAQQSISAQQNTINKLTGVNQERIDALQAKFVVNEERVVGIKEELSNIDSELKRMESSSFALSKSEDTLKKYQSVRTKLDVREDKITKDLAFFKENTSCPVCKQDIEEQFRTAKLGILNTKMTELVEANQQLDSEISNAQKMVAQLRKETETVTELQFELKRLFNEEQRLMKQNTDIIREVQELSNQPDINSEKEILQALESKYSEKEIACSNVTKESSDLKLVAGLLKDGGIKSKIISKYIPIINQRINKYLADMDTFVNFTLDEEFNEVIKSRHRDTFSYASFSEGEKQKIDLSLLFTWRHVAKIKNSVTTNLLILDEVFDSSLDTQATDELLKILKTLGDDTNLFIISHKGEVLVDKFNRTISFEKVNGFSKARLE
jgi:DNA repair exonuclease SbcCD ATPase subunit